MDHPSLFSGRRVLDLGCGCGAVGIAAAAASDTAVVANDIDDAALAATAINAELNSVSNRITLDKTNFLDGQSGIDHVVDNFDVVLAGDLLFDERVGDAVADLAKKFVCSNVDGDKLFLLGDPGRWFMADEKCRGRLGGLACVAKYEMPVSAKEEHYGITAGLVYRVLCT